MRWFRLEPRDQTGAAGAAYDGEGLGGDLQRIWRLARNERVLLSFGLTFLLIAAGMRTLIPQAVASTLVVAINPGTSAGAHAALARAARRLALLAVGYGVASGLRGLTMSIVENRLLSRLRRQTFARMLQQDIAFHDERSVGELTSRLNSDCEAVSSGLSMNFNILLRSAVQVLFGACYLTYTSWRLSLMLLGVWGVLFSVYTVYGRFTRRASLIRQDALAGLNTMATEALQNVRTVRSLGSEPTMLCKYRDASRRLIFIEHQRAAAYGLYVMFYGSLTEGIKAVTLGAGGILVGTGAMGPEQLAAAMLYIDSVVGSSLSVGGQYRQLMQSIGSSRRVFEYTEMPPSPSVLAEEEGVGRRLLPDELHASVQFRGVTFTYPSRPGEPVLQGLDLDLVPGTTTALVGASGSGKSTVAALLQRWYEPDSGEVLLDGVPLRNLDPGWMRSLFGFVTQDPRLFSATVLENIVLGLGDAGSEASRAEAGLLDGLPLTSAGGLPELTPEAVRAAREAAEAAHVHEFIDALPDGYHTMVGDVRLSGGQRQRISLARALARKPRIVVLDEATSALDRKTEAAVQASVGEYVRKNSATCLVIAHRLSTVVDADRIVVMDSGRIAEQGTHDELLARQGLYSRLVKGGN